MPIEAAIVETMSSPLFPARTTSALFQTRNHVRRQKIRATMEYIVNCEVFSSGTERPDEKRTHQSVGDKHDPFEPRPSENRLLRIGSKPSALHAVVVFVMGAGHAGLVGFEGFATTALLRHSRDQKLFSVSSPGDKSSAKLRREIVDG